ncbi:ABC transporter substrate-binding protein [Gordonia zhaorongruii]|uniref:ABC transporter substrate-binding protein n=1 Tax=Gordonia zhaorongruii TaxID=2597659 RepID=UPI00104817EB|nr:ABC transporter substrate-binding protein [Gordonia zhaorongruii]
MTHATTRRRFPTALAALTAAAAVLLSASACVSREDGSGAAANEIVNPSDLAGLTLQVGDQKGGTESLLRAAGQLEDTPYKVKFSTFTSGPPQIEAATAGKIDFAVTGNTPPIFGAASNAKIKIVSAYNNSATGDAILTKKGSPIKSVSDLRGMKVAVGKGSSAHAHLLLQLKKAGLRLGEDVTPVFLQPADAQSAFTSANVDAWAIWDPYTAITQMSPDVRTITTGQGVLNGYGFGVAATSALDDGKRNTAIKDLVIRIAKASDWSKRNPELWSAAYAKAVGIAPQAAKSAQDRSLRTAITLDDRVVESEQTVADAFIEAGQIEGNPQFADYVDQRYNDVVQPFVGKP